MTIKNSTDAIIISRQHRDGVSVGTDLLTAARDWLARAQMWSSSETAQYQANQDALDYLVKVISL